MFVVYFRLGRMNPGPKQTILIKELTIYMCVHVKYTNYTIRNAETVIVLQ